MQGLRTRWLEPTRRSRKAGAVTKIYCFHNSPPDREGTVFAMREDGVVLASHFCTNASYAYMDIGMDPERDWSKKRAIYDAACPDGYELVWVPDATHGNCAGLDEAYARNQLLAQRKELEA